MPEKISFSDFPILDDEQVEMLTESGSPGAAELIMDLLDLFESESQGKFSEIDDALKNSDMRALERAAHAIAGSSANIGGKRLWKLCKSIEENAKEGRNEGDIPEQIKQAKTLYRETIQALRNLVQELEQQADG